ncbi:MAG: hypothetical protein K9M01_02110 [Candidatus Omnitrophica bacterium]|nr:hypothetical protein [Candidatus Omnitrophota bacterium]
MQGIGAAIIAIYIPVIIIVFSNIYKNRDEESKDLAILDYYVVLYHFFNFKKFILWVAFLFLPPFFWVIPILWIRIILLLVFSAGIFFTIALLFKLWLWLKGVEKNEYRKTFLKDEKDFSILSRAWYSIFDSKQLTSQQENEFFSIFKRRVKGYKEENEFRYIAQLLFYFEQFYDNRSLELNLATKDVLQYLLKLYCIFWQTEKDDNKDKTVLYLIKRHLKNIVRKNWDALVKNKYTSSFIMSFVEHVKQNVQKEKYLEDILSFFFDLISERIPVDFTRHDYEDYLTIPDYWKITVNNLKDSSKNLIPKIFLDNYMNKMKYRIMREGETEKYDYRFDEFTMFLFPKIDPIKWGRVFIIYCYGIRSGQMGLAIEKKWNIGKIGRSFAFTGNNIEEEIKKRDEEEKIETLELFRIVYNNLFSKDRINYYLDQLKDIKPDTPMNEKHYEVIKRTLEELKFYLENVE